MCVRPRSCREEGDLTGDAVGSFLSCGDAHASGENRDLLNGMVQLYRIWQHVELVDRLEVDF